MTRKIEIDRDGRLFYLRKNKFMVTIHKKSKTNLKSVSLANVNLTNVLMKTKNTRLSLTMKRLKSTKLIMRKKKRKILTLLEPAAMKKKRALPAWLITTPSDLQN